MDVDQHLVEIRKAGFVRIAWEPTRIAGDGREVRNPSPAPRLARIEELNLNHPLQRLVVCDRPIGSCELARAQLSQLALDVVSGVDALLATRGFNAGPSRCTEVVRKVVELSPLQPSRRINVGERSVPSVA